MRLSTTHRVLLGFVVAALILLGLMGLVLNLLYRSAQSQVWVDHTYVVLGSLGELVSALNRADADQRAYLITGEQSYFAARDDAMSTVESMIIDLRELTADNPRQQDRLPGLANLVQIQLEAMNVMLSTNPDARSELARQQVAQDAAETTAILAAVAGMQAEDRRLLVERRDLAHRQAVEISTLMALVAAVCLVVLMLLFFRIRAEIGERERAQAGLRRLATTDDLTGLQNRHAFMAQGERAVSLASRYRHPVACLMLDADHFKRINDDYGHAAGDAVLEALAETARHQLREVDIIGRVGGEEFAVLLPETGLDQALLVADRLRAAFAGTSVTIGNRTIGFTVSIGVAELAANMDLPAILSAADRGLYAAKDAGRNRVAAAP